jgi:hypothetical protein
MENDFYRYTVEVSDDAKNWKQCVDRRESRRDSPHDYVQLDKALKARYVRLNNLHTPGGGAFSVGGFRIFGNGLGKEPAVVKNVKVERDGSDARVAHLSWDPVEGADFYVIRYGTAKDGLFHNYQVYQTNRFEINSLNEGVSYYFTVDAVNDSGIAKGSRVILVK